MTPLVRHHSMQPETGGCTRESRAAQWHFDSAVGPHTARSVGANIACGCDLSIFLVVLMIPHTPRVKSLPGHHGFGWPTLAYQPNASLCSQSSRA